MINSLKNPQKFMISFESLSFVTEEESFHLSEEESIDMMVNQQENIGFANKNEIANRMSNTSEK